MTKLRFCFATAAVLAIALPTIAFGDMPSASRNAFAQMRYPGAAANSGPSHFHGRGGMNRGGMHRGPYRGGHPGMMGKRRFQKH